MKRLCLFLMFTFVSMFFLAGCNENEGGKSNNETGTGNIPSLEEVLVGTWKLYGGFDQSGTFMYSTGDAINISFSFDAKNGFSGYYRESDGFVNADFSGIYDCSDSKAADENPYNWYYYCTINKGDLNDQGDYSFAVRLPAEYNQENVVYLSFAFRELDGEECLYEEAMGLYYKKQ